MALVADCTLEDFLKPRLQRALEAEGVRVDAHVQHYLLRLLVTRAVAAEGDTSLVELELQARTCEPAHRGRALRKVGDHALFTTGLFVERLRKRGISTRYYCDKGCSAYAEAADAHRPSDRAHAPAVRVLARRFRDVVGVLRRVRSGTSLSEAADASALLQRHPQWSLGYWGTGPVLTRQ